MARNVEDIINELTPAQCKRVEARAAQLIAEEITLRDLRRARKLTQQKIAKSLHIGQEGVSKLEKRSDLLISTLRDYVQAMGGKPVPCCRISRPQACCSVRNRRGGAGPQARIAGTPARARPRLDRRDDQLLIIDR